MKYNMAYTKRYIIFAVMKLIFSILICYFRMLSCYQKTLKIDMLSVCFSINELSGKYSWIFYLCSEEGNISAPLSEL